MYTYLLLNLFTISFPLFKSFEEKIAYAKKWGPLFIAITISAVFFIVWDHYFTVWGVWGFNPEYILGIFILDLPLEEWLFFITVPFACIFIYEVILYFVKTDPLRRYSNAITLVIIIGLLLLAFFNQEKLYTFTTSIFTAVFLILHWLLYKNVLLGRFYITYLIHLIPLFIVNGILTALPVVVYNNAENLGLRVYTVPIEDTIYSMLLLLMNVTIYEFVKNKGIFIKQNK